MFLNTLSGRFLVLTILFVMLAEVFIFVPSIARFREDWLLNRLERAQIASLSRMASETIDPALEQELLETAGVYNVVLRRDEVRELALASPMPQPISATYDLRDASPGTLIRDALQRLIDPEPRVVRVIGAPVEEAGLLIEVTVPTGPLRAAMIDYGLRILALSALISVFTAALLFLAVRRVLVKPIKGVVAAMQTYADAPEDSRRIIRPSADIRELREAERALEAMQTQLTAMLRQRERLAALGLGVAKISHDLRNILTSAQLFADRMEASSDPVVKRLAPKLMGSIGRAVSLCETTLAFGRAEEPPPSLDRTRLATIVDDVVAAESVGADRIAFDTAIPIGLVVRADPEQLYRVIANLVRNARQAIEAAGRAGRIEITAGETPKDWWIEVADDGPGLPDRAQSKLFTPFEGGVRKGGSGLGLVISAELVRGHGGRLSLVETSERGTRFRVELPKSVILHDAAAE